MIWSKVCKNWLVKASNLSFLWKDVLYFINWASQSPRVAFYQINLRTVCCCSEKWFCTLYVHLQTSMFVSPQLRKQEMISSQWLRGSPLPLLHQFSSFLQFCSEVIHPLTFVFVIRTHYAYSLDHQNLSSICAGSLSCNWLWSDGRLESWTLWLGIFWCWRTHSVVG